MHRWTAGGGADRDERGTGRGTTAEVRDALRKVAKKNAKENANRPLDITGEMFPDLSRFYLAACLWQVLIRISSVSFAPFSPQSHTPSLYVAFRRVCFNAICHCRIFSRRNRFNGGTGAWYSWLQKWQCEFFSCGGMLEIKKMERHESTFHFGRYGYFVFIKFANSHYIWSRKHNYGSRSSNLATLCYATGKMRKLGRVALCCREIHIKFRGFKSRRFDDETKKRKKWEAFRRGETVTRLFVSYSWSIVFALSWNAVNFARFMAVSFGGPSYFSILTMRRK